MKAQGAADSSSEEETESTKEEKGGQINSISSEL